MKRDFRPVLRILGAGIVVLAAGGRAAGQDRQTPSWEKLAGAYRYEAKAPAAKEESRSDPDYFVQRIALTNAKGESVPGLFRRPKSAGVYPCVLLLHGLGSKKEDMSALFGRPLADKGIATLALDAPRHGERRKAEGQAAERAPGQFVWLLHAGILEYRLALDYLKTRKDVDSNRIGLLGYSMGAMMGAILSGVDDRVKATVLCVGGDMSRLFSNALPPALKDMADSVSPANYVGHISPRPVFMINGRQDQIVNEAAARALHNAAREPKEIVWADSGHFLPPAAAGKGVEWLAAKLARAP